MQRGARLVFRRSTPMQRGARFALRESAPMQRGARAFFCESAPVQRGARFLFCDGHRLCYHPLRGSAPMQHGARLRQGSERVRTDWEGLGRLRKGLNQRFGLVGKSWEGLRRRNKTNHWNGTPKADGLTSPRLLPLLLSSSSLLLPPPRLPLPPTPSLLSAVAGCV